jgi:hypothetical protein
MRYEVLRKYKLYRIKYIIRAVFRDMNFRIPRSGDRPLPPAVYLIIVITAIYRYYVPLMYSVKFLPVKLALLRNRNI